MGYAQAVNTTATFTERDVRKGIAEQIALETPVQSTLGKDPAPLAQISEFEMKTYASRTTAGVIEGYEPVSTDFQNNLSNKAMLANRFVKQWRPVGVTKEMKLLGNQYNRPDPLADNIMDKTKELYSDVELTLLSDTESVAPAAGTTASQTRSIFRMLSNADARFSDTPTTPASAYRTPASSILVSKSVATAVNETDISALITSVVKARRKAGLRFMGLCTPEMRDQFDSFSRTDKSYTTSAFPVSRFNQKQGSIDREVTFYKSSNGSVELMTTFDLDSTVLFGLLSPDLIKLGYAQGVQVNHEGASSQIEKRVIDVIYTPRVLNPGGHGKIITGATA
jgi:hypothetical protein